MVSVVIPAHNEGSVIGDLLEALAGADSGGADSAGADSDGWEIVVVCNGCADDTADRARRFSPPVRVLEIDSASKTEALNLGDQASESFPRFYVDADVVISPADLLKVSEVLESGAAEAAAPGVAVDLTRSSRAVRAYYEIWSRLPSIKDDVVGRGCFGVSVVGRHRFERFPDTLGDDTWFRNQFPLSQRSSVPGTRCVVRAPRDLRSLIRRRVRVVSGNRLLSGDGQTELPRGGVLHVLVTEPRLVVCSPVFLFVTLAARTIARWRRLRGIEGGWDRDESTRH